MSPPPSFRDFVMEQAARRGLTTSAAIARAAGTDASSLSRWMAGHNGATVDSCRRIAEALEVSLSEVLVASGAVSADEIQLDPLPPELLQIAAMHASAEYTEQEKKALLAGVDYARQQWEAMVEAFRASTPVEPRMRRARHGR